MAEVCQRTVISDYGRQLENYAVAMGIASGITGWYFTRQYNVTPNADAEAIMAGITSAALGGVIPFAIGWVADTYGKQCR